jgi:hypothetical protein
LLWCCCHANIAHFSNISKSIIIKPGILAYHDMVQFEDKEHNSEGNIFGVMSLLNFLTGALSYHQLGILGIVLGVWT